MDDEKAVNLVIAAPQAVAGRLEGILENAGITAQAVAFSGEEALSACGEGCMLLTTYALPDMAGAVLAERLGDGVSVLMIVPKDDEEALPEHVLPLRNPITPDALVQAVRTMAHCCTRMDALRAKAEKLSRMLEERKIIDRAKGRLMDALHMTEAQAHHHIQKKSMDTGSRIVDVAREILAAECLAQ